MPELVLKSVCLNITDGEHGTVKNNDKGEYFLLSSKNIKHGNIVISENDRKISEDTAININKRTKMEAGDIVLSTIGTIGESAIIPPDFNYEFQRSVGILKPDPTKITSEFLYYLTKTYKFSREAEKQTTGSVQECLFIGGLEKIKIPQMSLSEQNYITGKLIPIDKQININSKIINNIEEYIQLLFHKWFIDFNFPDENGKPYKDNRGEMIEVDGKMIPKEWSWSNISQVAEIVDCLHSKKPANNGNKHDNCLLQLENITSNGLLDLRNLYLVSDEAYKKWTSRIEVKEGDLIITNAGRIGAIAQIPEGYKFGIGRNITAIRPTMLPPTWFYLFFNSVTAQIQIKKNTDKGAFFGSLNVRGIKELRILVPTDDLLEQFESKARPLRRKTELLNNENQLLEETRDLLIKKLIN